MASVRFRQITAMFLREPCLSRGVARSRDVDLDLANHQALEFARVSQRVSPLRAFRPAVDSIVVSLGGEELLGDAIRWCVLVRLAGEVGIYERTFCRLKDLRRVATRYDRLATNDMAAVCIAATISY